MQKKVQPTQRFLDSLWIELSEEKQAAMTGGSNSRPYNGPTAVKWIPPGDRMLPPGM